MKPVRLLIADDSFLMRQLLSDLLTGVPEIQVVGVARDGEEALVMFRTLFPDVVTLDLEMPKMDGLRALEAIQRERPTPVIVVSAYTQKGAQVTLEALEKGAFDFVPKPSGTISLDIGKVRDELIAKILAASQSGGSRMRPEESGERKAKLAHLKIPGEKIVAIGASTGGTRALAEILPRLPAALPAPVVVVQHMPAGFTTSLAERLNGSSRLRIDEAAQGDFLRPGEVKIAPGDRHLVVTPERRVRLTQDPPQWGVRPSVDRMMTSAAEVYGAGAVGILLTGMGHDGALGMKAIKERGGTTIVQNQETCTVFGMPQAAIKAQCVDAVLPLYEIPGAIVSLLVKA
jgi:two-component system chemotaxis response regulator CheB